jgi:hypothetical protein
LADPVWTVQLALCSWVESTLHHPLESDMAEHRALEPTVAFTLHHWVVADVPVTVCHVELMPLAPELIPQNTIPPLPVPEV